jgi:hypothetical protein
LIPKLDIATADRFANIALGHVTREYPNKLQHTLAGPADARTPRKQHPIFYGSFDWHSCVHSYWLLARVLKRFPNAETAERIRTLFDQQITAVNVAGECAFLALPTSRGFERPYGWAWILKLAAELRDLEDGRWRKTFAPLADVFAQRYRDFLPIATYPVRVGAHPNTAFGLRLAADYAAATGDDALLTLLRQTALRWYGEDRDCPAWGEPSGDDFLSSALIEAECMRVLMPAEEFAAWFARFLPHIENREPKTLFTPASVSDRSDGKIAHLDGLNLSRAWCWRSLAAALSASDPRKSAMLKTAAQHYTVAVSHIDSDYMGEHWLATYALLAIDEVGV